MRKRLASNKQKNSVATESDSESNKTFKQESPAKGKGKKRGAEENDEIIAAAKERKRAAVEQSKLAAEELANAMKEVEGLRNLGEVETFSVDLSVSRRVNRDENRSARWNPMWNGRKNFKKFRKAKQSVSVGVGRHMIQLVDYKGKSAASQGTLIPYMSDLDYFFPAPVRGYNSESQNSNNGAINDTMDDLAMDDSPMRSRTHTHTQQTKSSSRSSRSNRSNRSGRSLFVMEEDSDNELGFDD
jgi:hypothetical protein